MSYLSISIVLTSNNHFMARISSTLCKLGIIAITCNKSWMKIEFSGEDFSIRFQFPNILDHLQAVVEVILLTPFYESNIQTIRYHVDENLK
ncbi:MAG: hypothetical protein P0116_12325 [Candidatus Nitrosocosmicus sp.]|nr:hypothetical protein [Candidatus Nitrosocosmicus sp.]